MAPLTPSQPARIAPVGITAWTLLSAAGAGRAALQQAVALQTSGLRPNDDASLPLACWVGRVAMVDDTPLPAPLAAWDARATRLAWQGLQLDGFADAARAALARHGPARVGLVLGSAASTIGVSEQAYRSPAADGGFPLPLRRERLNTPHALAMFLQEQLGLEGPCLTVSTACSSSAKVFAVAQRWLQLGAADAVVVAGVDALCGSLMYGFRALGLVSPEPCRPFDAARQGISLGEAAGFALLERGSAALQLIGHGESNDAHHMSGPHPEGRGAELALDDALARAGLAAAQVDYLNLHGTATPQNDAVEAALVARRYAPHVHASATKGMTGHAMGAAGIVEAAICWIALEHGLRSGSAGAGLPDPALGERFALQLHRDPVRAASRLAASHSFGFGGSNAVLLFARGEGA